ncbi:TRAP transporter substrate-binding protein [Spartinivicinus ruber]|uniref:TRAP transporter substrate-binding protein n=1 Tax=Spartinivicinus ruber TaxID=2683272 RepID=UPI0013D5425C|nr:TRAP transporter substrate-binding protein [Spartinivicinus ruber]
MKLLKTIAASVSITLACVASALAAPIEIKFSHVVAENTPKGKMATKFKELIEERLQGKVTVKVFPNAQLFGDDKVLEAMLLGDVQLAAPALSKIKKYNKQVQVFDLPFLFDNMAAVDRFQQGSEGKKLLKSLEKRGLVGLGYLHNGFKQLSASSPLKTPTDAKGKKFRIMASDVLVEQFKAVSANPVKKPFAEVFTLLQTKAIDGQENTWSNMYSKKFYEVQPYITESNHGVLDYVVLSSKEFWSSLPTDIRPAVEKALQEAITYGNQVALAKDQEDKQAIIDSKRSQIVSLTPEERQQWVETMKPVWKKFEAELGKELIHAALAANKGK